METLASVWARDPGDLRDLAEKRHEPPAAFASQCGFYGSPPAGLMWTEQLSPHLQRNKQLQDTLLQREEELARLQEENNKLRGFLSSSFVRNLEQKAKKLTADGTRRRPKRNLDGEAFSRQQVSKRVCRNLTAEFCSESFETSTHSEPNLDLWVLQTLGLKDRDTIDTSNEFSSECIGGLVYDTAVTPSSSPEDTLSSSFGSPVASSTPSSVHGFCQRSTHDYRYRECQADCDNPAESTQNCMRSQVDVAAAEHPGTTRSHDTSTASEICSDNPPLFWSHRWTPSQDSVQFSPPAGWIHFSPMSTSNQPWTPGSPTSPTRRPSAAPPTPCGRSDLAFSMLLSPSSSVKTHSFPQGQAFVRKDTGGRWSFTWVPKQGP
ncbi:geminin coiled-coil domain-containing protein 1 [Stegastes partitus]|uniref:Geminin coiled-coil domain-containing protein 1 n=1 Tax=Stegastes partitus TaxID=144197 RepID=A0A9Y4JZM2_9TELE|nr:PREDICTED: geminin coiled-coil domain-containing protein 1 [Stegastes partitus]